jgi:hypothetical protein
MVRIVPRGSAGRSSAEQTQLPLWISPQFLSISRQVQQRSVNYLKTAHGQSSAMLCGLNPSGAAGLSAMLKLARIVLMAAAAGLVAAGCTTSETPFQDMPPLNLGALGMAGPGQRTVAFEVIDGAPDHRWLDKLRARLTQEATASKVAAVSREQPSQYVIRAYVAAHVQGQKTTITWVWDVFTAADHQRVARLTGEVPGAPSERAWAAADDAVVARIAQDSMSSLAAFLASGPSPNVASASGAEPLAFLPSRP